MRTCTFDRDDGAFPQKSALLFRYAERFPDFYKNGAGLLLLGPHDPYLDTRDRDVLLPDKALQKLVWRTVGNPGAVVLDGRISGVWTARTVRDRLELSVTAWQAFSARQQSMLEIRAQEYAAFRGLSLLKYTLEDG